MNQELKEAFERAREASKGRTIREEPLANIRNKIDREKHGVPVLVVHPEIGSICVKARSPFDAQCAAEEKLGLPFLALRECEVWEMNENGKEAWELLKEAGLEKMMFPEDD